jgi:ribosomal protein L3 glutamine methyltransferase
VNARYAADEGAQQPLETIGDFVRWAVSAFGACGVHYGHGTDNAWDEARWLVLGAVALPFDSPDWVLAARLDRRERQRVRELLDRRLAERVPTAYLLGEAWFAGLRFAVDERVLIPRSPIAEMIEAGFEPWIGEVEPLRILDLCCGSGCIGIAAALHFPGASVDLADISADALDLARLNVAAHGLEDRVAVLHSDLFEALGRERYDLIVCNPPYVDRGDMEALPPEYRHEPRLALAAGEDGLDLVRRILDEAAAHLSDHGLLVLEVGNGAEALEQAFPELAFLWPEFERGGHGVAVIGAADLRGGA